MFKSQSPFSPYLYLQVKVGPSNTVKVFHPLKKDGDNLPLLVIGQAATCAQMCGYS